MKPLVVIPSFMRKQEHLDALMDTIFSIVKTVPDETDILVVDDHSPDQALVDQLAERAEGSIEQKLPPFELIRKKVNSGFSATVNFGLRKAREEGRDAVLMNADIEMHSLDWVNRCRETLGPEGEPAGVVGALLIYPQSGLIQHAGIHFSYLTRRFFERYKYGPSNLPDALHKEVLPVTGAFQYIRADVLTDVGIYDESFKLGYEDVDYCIRTFKSGWDCIYNPEVRAYHHESMIRGEKTEQVLEWEVASWRTFAEKYRGENFGQFVHAVL